MQKQEFLSLDHFVDLKKAYLPKLSNISNQINPQPTQHFLSSPPLQQQLISEKINKDCKFFIKLQDYEKNGFNDNEYQYWGPIIGNESLDQRFENQNNSTIQYRNGVQKYHQEIKDFIEHYGKKKEKFEQLYKDQVNLRRKFLGIMKQVEVLRCKGRPLQSGEYELSEKLHSMKLFLSGGPERQLEILKLKQSQQDISHGKYDIEPNDINSLKERLNVQSRELIKLITMINKDKRDKQIIEQNS